MVEYLLVSVRPWVPSLAVPNETTVTQTKTGQTDKQTNSEAKQAPRFPKPIMLLCLGKDNVLREEFIHNDKQGFIQTHIWALLLGDNLTVAQAGWELTALNLR